MSKKKLLLVGAGGVGSAIAASLAAAGIGAISVYKTKSDAAVNLVARLQHKSELNPQHPESFYGGGAEGYTDYPTL